MTIILNQDEKIYHSKIVVTTTAKDGSERLGAHAECKYWIGESKTIVDVSTHGKSKEEATAKLMTLLTGNGRYEVEEV